jgi:hypothetical protein
LTPYSLRSVGQLSIANCSNPSQSREVQTLLAKPQPLRPQYADPELLKLQAAVA